MSRINKRCTKCHLGQLVPRQERPVSVDVSDCCSYDIVVSGVSVCDQCECVTLGKGQAKLAKAKAYSLHKEVVFERDGWACQECGAISSLEVHHKIRRSQAGKNKHDLGNLVSLCVECHRRRHDILDENDSTNC